jgi:DNA-binding Lrp family transcriptional regulator
MVGSPNISPSDRRILLELQSNARQTNKRLATAAGLAQSTSLERVRELERRGVITGYHAAVDLAALGRGLQAMVTLRIHPKSQAGIDRLVAQLEALPETLCVYLLSGADDVLVHLAVSDADHLRAVVLSRIATLDGVVDERTSLVFEHHRRTVIDLLDPHHQPDG